MYLYVETWQPTHHWLELPKDERNNYVAAVGGAIQQLIAAGVEIVGWALNDNDTDHHNGFDYFAVWKFPNKEIIKQFESTVTAAGWYNYFDQVNCSGSLTNPLEILSHSIDL